ncbi:Vacuole-localized protein 4 [Pseudocercospora fuligena]|uniref:Vacuole-localized protein 4 n=1 Tax=Pseudocercospora fuligena TaxID=685502 RepID=A0A8H6RS40_9PEZI|nr:Vacuole-localized protein 4 [Pseudocercospora fuligena]
MKSATFAALVGVAAAQQAPAYYGASSSSSSASTTTYACNPAHQYPEGQVCTTIDGSLTLVTKTATAPAYGATTSSAATTTTYACNPAHQYPEGQVCTTIDGSLTLVTKTGTATAPAGYGTTSAPASTTYACNPAHQYPAGQICTTISGSLTLITTTGTSSAPTTSGYVDKCQEAYKQCIAAGQPEVKCSCDLTTCSGEDAARIRSYCASATANLTSTASATKPASYPTSTTSCAAPGSYDSQGRYSCNPAHQYPAGQTCQFVGGCPVLVNGTTSTSSAPSSTPTCPAAGSTDSKGRYSCNPAHQYPEGQTCALVDGCYFLVGGDVYTTEVQTAYTTYCPQPTTFTHQQKTYTVTEATTLTLPCKGGCTVTKPVSTPTQYTTEVHTAYTTYCPQPTTFTHEQKTYTVTQATTVTLPCKGGCTVTKPVTSAPPQYTTPIIVKPKPSESKPWGNYTQPPSYTTKVVTELTTYCPQPTTFTHGPSTYTVTKATTLTLPCQGGCTVTVSKPPVYTTETKTALTTYCPQPTTITHQQSTYTVTKPTTLTLPCQGGCVVTKTVPVSAPSATPSCPAPGSTDKNGRYSCNPAHAYPAGQTCQMVDGCYYLVTPPTSSVPIQQPSTYVAPPPSSKPVESQPPAQPTTYAAPPPSGPAVPPVYPSQSTIVSQPSATMPGASSTSLTPYTGAAAPLKTGAPLMAAVAMGALFL